MLDSSTLAIFQTDCRFRAPESRFQIQKIEVVYMCICYPLRCDNNVYVIETSCWYAVGTHNLQQETYHLWVDLIDGSIQTLAIAKTDFQLLGVTYMHVAAKFEEIYPPTIDDYVYVETHGTVYKKPDNHKFDTTCSIVCPVCGTATVYGSWMKTYPVHDIIMAKAGRVIGTLRTYIAAGKASSSPPLGPALGQVRRLLDIVEFLYIPSWQFLFGCCVAERSQHWDVL